MKNDKLMKIMLGLLLFFPIIILFIMLMICLHINDDLRKANESLKKEKYECKIELDKYKEKYLNLVINN